MTVILRTIGTRVVSFLSGYALSDITQWVSDWNPFDNEEEGFYSVALKLLGLFVVVSLGFLGYTLWTGKFFKR